MDNREKLDRIRIRLRELSGRALSGSELNEIQGLSDELRNIQNYGNLPRVKADPNVAKAKAKKSVIKGLDESADITLKFSHDLGEVLNYKPKLMSDNNKKEIKKLSTIAKKDFNQLAKKYGMMCKKLVENQKQRIDYWENQGNKKIK